MGGSRVETEEGLAKHTQALGAGPVSIFTNTGTDLLEQIDYPIELLGEVTALGFGLLGDSPVLAVEIVKTVAFGTQGDQLLV